MDNNSLAPNPNDNQTNDSQNTNPNTIPAAEPAATNAIPNSANSAPTTETISTFSSTETITPQPMTSPKKKLPTQTVLLAAFSVVCLIVAVVFGVLYVTSQNSNQKSNTATTHTTTPQTTIDIDEEKDEEDLAKDSTKKDKDTTESTTDKTTTDTTTETAVEVGVHIKDNYLYVPEWKVRFPLDDSLTEYGYSVIQNTLSNSYGNYVIGLTALQKSDVDSSPQAPYYDTINSCAMATVSRTLSTNPSLQNLVGPAKITDLNGFSYVVYDYNSKTYCSFSESYSNFNTVVQKIVNILAHPETY